MSYAKAGLGRGIGSAFSNMGNMLMGIGDRRRQEDEQVEARRLQLEDRDRSMSQQLQMMALGDPSLRVGGDTAPDKQVIGMIGNKAMVPKGESTWQGHDITMPSGSTTRVWRDPKYEETRMRREQERERGERNQANYAAWEQLDPEIRGGAYDGTVNWGPILAETVKGRITDQRNREMAEFEFGLQGRQDDRRFGMGFTPQGTRIRDAEPDQPTISVSAGGITKKFPDTEEGQEAAIAWRDRVDNATGEDVDFTKDPALIHNARERGPGWGRFLPGGGQARTQESSNPMAEELAVLNSEFRAGRITQEEHAELVNDLKRRYGQIR